LIALIDWGAALDALDFGRLLSRTANGASCASPQAWPPGIQPASATSFPASINATFFNLVTTAIRHAAGQHQ
jgi:hypothetical protein